MWIQYAVILNVITAVGGNKTMKSGKRRMMLLMTVLLAILFSAVVFAEDVTPAEDLPTSSTPITGITLTPAGDGRHYALKWDEVSGAFYTVQMREPQTNRWVTVCQKVTSARVTPDVTESQMGVSCSTNADQATTVGWAAVSGATSYEVHNEMLPNTNDWISKVTTTSASAILRLPPNSKQNLRVSAIGPVTFRIYALNAAGTSCLAYKEYTAQNAYMTSCDYTYTTPSAPAFSSSASVGVKEAYALMLTQAINNTRMETGTVNMTATTTQNSTASALGTSENSNAKKVITCQYKLGAGTATILTTEDDKTTSSTAFSVLQTILVPSSGVTYLYDQHNLATFQQYVSNTVVLQSGDKTIVSMTLKPENVTTSKEMIYHPGLVGAAVTPEDLKSFQGQGSGVQNATAMVGASTIQATINENYTLDHLEINNPYRTDMSMRVVLTTTTVTVNTDLTYSYSFNRDGNDAHTGDHIFDLEHPSVAAAEPTCSEDGHGAAWMCTIPGCGYLMWEKGKEVIPAYGHNWSGWAIVKHAVSCSELSESQRICSRCGESETKFEATVSHTPGAWIIDRAPTCLENGVLIKKCTICGETLATDQVASTGHTKVIDPAVAATCTDPGFTEGEHCSVCNEILMAQMISSARGHDYVLQEIKEPTCTEDGSHIYICRNDSSHSEREPIAKLGHIDENNDGYCNRCGEMMTGGDHCKYCGKIHDGAFGWLVKFFHSIFAVFKR